MMLGLREAAVLLGIPVRTLRARVARGDIPAAKDGKKWLIDRRNLPLTDGQRQILQQRAEEVRQAVDTILPSRMAATADRRARSVADLDAFRETVAVLGVLRATPTAPGAAVAVGHLEEACGCLAEASFVYERERKLVALSDARARVGRAVAALLAAGGIPPAEPVHRVVTRLEATVSPAIGGYARWVAGLPGHR